MDCFEYLCRHLAIEDDFKRGTIYLLKKKYNFLYIPQDESVTKRFSVKSATVAYVALGLFCLFLTSGLYFYGLTQGVSWLPGGSAIQHENSRLVSELKFLGDRVVMLKDAISASYMVQEQVALVAGIDPMDENVREAGIGGRQHDVSASPSSQLHLSLDTLLRQARVQRSGFEAILDTLDARELVRGHIPAIRPVDSGWLSSSFGRRNDPFTGKSKFHRGLDYSVPTGTPVLATADGVVKSVRHDRGFGKLIRIDHGNGVVTTYAHLSKWNIKQGQVVKRGDVIAESGNTGRSTAPHIHYEVAVNGRYVNPGSFVIN
ncbi:M23 family metallopeptidase [bacterium]|nr:M23 family metallopeptidase [bacterium]